MSVKPENTFIGAVHKHLPPAVYRMKNHNRYVAGVVDVWYSGNRADLWVEYKFIPRVPKRGDVHPGKLLSALQLEWLVGRHQEGRSVAVVIGCPNGGVILCDPDEWSADLTASEYTQRLLERKAIASWISQKTTR